MQEVRRKEIEKEVSGGPEEAMRRFKLWLELRTRLGDNVEQRTPAWYARRHTTRATYGTVGGSQLGALSGNGRFGKTPWDVVISLANLVPFGWGPALAWGNVLEDVVDGFARGHGAETVEVGSLLGAVPGHANSVDGVGIVDLERLAEHAVGYTDHAGAYHDFRDVDEALEYAESWRNRQLAVMEYKMYFSAPAKKRGVCEDHVCQVLGGLDTIPHAAMGVLLTAVTRRCSLAQWRWAPGYNPQTLGAGRDYTYPGQDEPPLGLAMAGFHLRAPARELLDTLNEVMAQVGAEPYPDWVRPLGFGERVPGVPDPFASIGSLPRTDNNRKRAMANIFRMYLVEVVDRADDSPIDLGRADKAVLLRHLWLATAAGFFVTKCSRTFTTADGFLSKHARRRSAAAALDDICDGTRGTDATLAAVLPVKVLDATVHYVERPMQQEFTQKHQARIWGALEASARLCAGDDLGAVREWFARVCAGEAEAPPPRVEMMTPESRVWYTRLNGD